MEFHSLPKPDFSLGFLQTKQHAKICYDSMWADGQLPNGRPYLVEVWQQVYDTIVTYYVPTFLIEDENTDSLVKMLSEAGLIEILNPNGHYSAAKVPDSLGNDVWSINIILADEQSDFVRILHPTAPYYQK